MAHERDVDADASFLDMVDAPVLELHRSNVLRMEIEELLQECRLDLSPSSATATVSWAKAVPHYMETLETALQSIHKKNPSGVIKRQANCPFPLHSAKITDVVLPSSLPLTPPISTTIGLTTKAGNANVLPTLECAILIPNDYWTAKDYLHNRYFDKRNLLLWKVAQHLSQFAKTVGTVEWRYSNGRERTPCLLLTPPTETVSTSKRSTKKQRQVATVIKMPRKVKFRVQLTVAMESADWIPSIRLFPNRSNLGSLCRQTPVYNHDLVHDVVSRRIAAAIGHASPTMKDALILLKVWSLQRGFLQGHDTLTVTSLGVILLYLHRTKHVSPRMAPLQVFTVVLKFLAETNWLGEKVDGTADLTIPTQRHSPSEAYTGAITMRHPIQRATLVLPLEGHTEAQTIAQCDHARLYAQQAKDDPILPEGDPPTLLQCFQHCTDGPILLDSSMAVNYLGQVSPASMRLIQSAAQATMECLHAPSVTRPFSYMFLSSARFWSSMDAVLKVPLRDIEFGKSTLWGKDKEDVGSFDSIARGIISVLRVALGDRVTSLRILTNGNGNVAEDSEQIPTCTISQDGVTKPTLQSPLGEDVLVLGLKINSSTCHRLVDRGPPADDVDATKSFVGLWGSEKAQLRRFKDGAVVNAVVWNTPLDEKEYVAFDGDEKTQGSIVERIARHILGLHFLKGKMPSPQFQLREMLSLVDGVAEPNNDSREFSSATVAHRNVMDAFDSLAEFLRKHSIPTLPVPGSTDEKASRLGLPLTIDAVEALSPSLRYSELFPPVPHSSLGGKRSQGNNKVSGVIMFPPVLIQIRFGMSSKWPSDLKAIGAAKTAMLIQLADGIESMKNQAGHDGDGFDGLIQVTPHYMDIGYKGYSWRIIVRADPELHLLRSLQKPSPEATAFLSDLTRKHVLSAMHHSAIHAIHTSHPSSGSVVRLARRWIASHLLSDLIPFEAIELMVAKVYTDRDLPLDAPTTVVSGFIRFLHILASHDWAKQPLIVDPQGQLSDDDHSSVFSQFERVRGSNYTMGPSMFIISPHDRQARADTDEDEAAPPSAQKGNSSKDSESHLWSPTFTTRNPEWVVLSRASALAKRSHDFLIQCAQSGNPTDWTAVFQETSSSFTSYNILLRVEPDFVVDSSDCGSTNADLSLRSGKVDSRLESSYTRSMRQRSLGPKPLRRNIYRNLNGGEEDQILHDWRPVEELVGFLREKFGSLALFFYNDLAPEVIGILWRPTSFVSQPFSVMNSDCVCPVDHKGWKSDSMVIHNIHDILRDMKQYCLDMIANVKIMDKTFTQSQGQSKKRSADSSHE